VTNPEQKTVHNHGANHREQVASTMTSLTRQHRDHNELQLPYQNNPADHNTVKIIYTAPRNATHSRAWTVLPDLSPG
jgi:hypothetical protein